MTAPMMISTWKAGSWITMGAFCSSIRRAAKVALWSHWQTVLLALVERTRQPALDQAEVSRSQKTQVGLPSPSSLRCFREILRGREPGEGWRWEWWLLNQPRGGASPR